VHSNNCNLVINLIITKSFPIAFSSKINDDSSGVVNEYIEANMNPDLKGS
jgi:hypothetical protein